MIENCPFCNPSREIAKFNESENFIAIYNVAPILPGHSLIIPKLHIESFLKFSDEELSEMTIFSRDTVQLLLKVFDADGFNWTIQEGEQAGQTVPHFHLHLIPRKTGDFPHPGDWYPELKKVKSKMIDSEERPQLSNSQLKAIVKKIKQISTKID